MPPLTIPFNPRLNGNPSHPSATCIGSTLCVFSNVEQLLSSNSELSRTSKYSIVKASNMVLNKGLLFELTFILRLDANLFRNQLGCCKVQNDRKQVWGGERVPFGVLAKCKLTVHPSTSSVIFYFTEDFFGRNLQHILYRQEIKTN